MFEKEKKNPETKTRELLNYDVCENILWTRQQKSSDLEFKHEADIRYLLLVEIGVFVGLVEYFIHTMVHLGLHEKNHILMHAIDELSLPIFYLFWLLLCLLPALISGYIVIFLDPIVKGSAIPLLKCYLNGVSVPKLFGAKTLVLKVMSVIPSMVSGLSGGSEGPFFHLGGIISGQIADNKYLTFNYNKKFALGTDRRDLIFCGTSVAIAICFSAPVAGVTVILEEISNFWNKNLIWRMFFTSCVGLFLNNILSLTLFYKSFRFELYTEDILYMAQYQVYHLPVICSIGVVGGLLGALWNEMHIMLTTFRAKYVKTNLNKVLEIIFVVWLINTLGFMLILYSPSCRENKDVEKSFKLAQFQCDKGSHSRSLMYFFTSPVFILHQIFDKDEMFELGELFIYFWMYFLTSALTLGLNVTLGIYIPNMLMGAVWGEVYSKILKELLPEGYFPDINYALFAVAAQMGGVFRMSISTVAIVIETTGVHINMAFPLILVVKISEHVAELINMGIYEIPNKNAPILSWDFIEHLEGKTSSDIMTSPVVCMHKQEKVSDVIEALRQFPAIHGFPIVENIQNDDPNEYFKGLMYLTHIEAILTGSFYYENQTDWISTITLNSFRDLRRFVFDIKAYEDSLQPNEKDNTLDFNLFLDPTVRRVGKYNGAFGLFNAFRGLCLRCLIVVNNNNQVKGIITRRDFLRQKTE